MSTIRIVLMAVLTAGVIAGAGWMALRGGPVEDPQKAKIERLMRRLGDTDPDLAREAAKELTLLLPASRPALRKAAESDDALLAKRAALILAKHPAESIP